MPRLRTLRVRMTRFRWRARKWGLDVQPWRSLYERASPRMVTAERRKDPGARVLARRTRPEMGGVLRLGGLRGTDPIQRGRVPGGADPRGAVRRAEPVRHGLHDLLPAAPRERDRRGGGGDQADGTAGGDAVPGAAGTPPGPGRVRPRRHEHEVQPPRGTVAVPRHAEDRDPGAAGDPPRRGGAATAPGGPGGGDPGGGPP